MKPSNETQMNEETPSEKRERLQWERKRETYFEKRLAGEAIQKLSDSLGIHETVCVQWEQELKTERKILEKLKIQKTLSESKHRKTDRVKTLSSLLTRINSEITKRDFSDVPTDKLILLGVKISEQLQDIVERENKEYFDSLNRLDVD